MPDVAFPDGIDDRHARTPSGLIGHASLISLLVLGALMALAMSGALAGDRSATQTLAGPVARLEVTSPDRLRNGVFFETRIAVTARRDIADLVIAIPPGLWQDMTINTMIPAAAEETFADGRFRFSYGRLAAGDRLEVKFDGQINPPLTLGTRGEVALFDGERMIGRLPLSTTVLP